MSDPRKLEIMRAFGFRDQREHEDGGVAATTTEAASAERAADTTRERAADDGGAADAGAASEIDPDVREALGEYGFEDDEIEALGADRARRILERQLAASGDEGEADGGKRRAAPRQAPAAADPKILEQVDRLQRTNDALLATHVSRMSREALPAHLKGDRAALQKVVTLANDLAKTGRYRGREDQLYTDAVHLARLPDAEGGATASGRSRSATRSSAPSNIDDWNVELMQARMDGDADRVNRLLAEKPTPKRRPLYGIPKRWLQV